MSTLLEKNKRRDRTFTREEMVNYTKWKLCQANEGIEFLSLKYNVLTCRYQGNTFRVYISSSRDYEGMRKPLERNPYRVSGWHKGSRKIFTSCDYYAMLVKVDADTKYVTETDEGIEGLFVSQDELNLWFAQKTSLPSGMINCYVHYIQTPGLGRSSIQVLDDREKPAIPLNHLYALGWTIR